MNHPRASYVFTFASALMLAAGCGDDPAACGNAKNGSAGVEGTVSLCPEIDAYSVEPTQLAIGSAVHLTASAHDAGGNPLTFAWQASAGLVADAHTASTTFTCTAAGDVTLTLHVSNGACEETASAVVTCAAK